MNNKKTDDSCSWMKHCFSGKRMRKHNGSGVASGVYCMGFIGAAVYFIQQATSFGMGITGFLKALVWPAFLVHNLLKFLEI